MGRGRGTEPRNHGKPNTLSPRFSSKRRGTQIYLIISGIAFDLNYILPGIFLDCSQCKQCYQQFTQCIVIFEEHFLFRYIPTERL